MVKIPEGRKARNVFQGFIELFYFIAALFIKTRNWNQYSCSSTDDDNLVLFKMEFYSVLKNNVITTFPVKIDLEYIM